MRGTHRAAAGAAVAAAMLLAAGCGGGSGGELHDDQAQPKEPAPLSSPASAGPDAADRRAVLAAVAGMTRESNAAYAKASAKDTKLTEYAADKALAQIEAELFEYRQVKYVFEGRKRAEDTRVTDLRAKVSPKTASVRECVDTSGWKPVHKESGKPVKVLDKHRRYTAYYQLRTIGDDWMVVTSTLKKNQPC